ncbi:hypothetical protein DY000_02045095 [Brassica cretica]|uniref:Uncharacterized protein n=1 Tax=Brassica cretica TaxID=69181 RepID=A0ABQ7ET64_BRACR|nr:hypothetical protein DY000_02045095 [Brassica cretica]
MYETPHDALNRIPSGASVRVSRQRNLQKGASAAETCRKTGCIRRHTMKRSLKTYTRKPATPPQEEQDQHHGAGM